MDSTRNQIVEFCKRKGRGYIFDSNDLLTLGLPYPALRTELVNLVRSNWIIRICRGIYCYPLLSEGKSIFPNEYYILQWIANKRGYKTRATGDYLEYLLGLKPKKNATLTLLTDGKIHTVNFENGYSAIIKPSKKLPSFGDTKSELAILILQYLHENKNTNIPNSTLLKLKSLFDTIPINEIDMVSVQPHLKSFLIQNDKKC